MSKILINGNQLEFLTEHILLNEQTQADLEGDTKSDEERLGFKTSVESGEFETYEGGKPYELFLAKTLQVVGWQLVHQLGQVFLVLNE